MFVNIISVKMKEKKFVNRIDLIEKDEWIKFFFICGVDFKFFNDVFDLKEVGLLFVFIENNRKKYVCCLIFILNFLIYFDF